MVSEEYIRTNWKAFGTFFFVQDGRIERGVRNKLAEVFFW